MLDDDRLSALRGAIDSLPLTEQQRELADETLKDMTTDDADMIIEAYRKLIDKLPGALAAIKAVRGR